MCYVLGCDQVQGGLGAQWRQADAADVVGTNPGLAHLPVAEAQHPQLLGSTRQIPVQLQYCAPAGDLSRLVCNHLWQVLQDVGLFLPCLEYPELFGEECEEYHNPWQRWVSQEVSMMSAAFPLEETGRNASGTFDAAKALAIQTAMSVFLMEPMLKRSKPFYCTLIHTIYVSIITQILMDLTKSAFVTFLYMLLYSPLCIPLSHIVRTKI